LYEVYKKKAALLVSDGEVEDGGAIVGSCAAAAGEQNWLR
jgi:hypothetical protein